MLLARPNTVYCFRSVCVVGYPSPGFFYKSQYRVERTVELARVCMKARSLLMCYWDQRAPLATVIVRIRTPSLPRREPLRDLATQGFTSLPHGP